MLDNATIDVIEKGFQNCRVTVWSIKLREVTEVRVESIEKGMAVGFFEHKTKQSATA